MNLIKTTMMIAGLSCTISIAQDAPKPAVAKPEAPVAPQQEEAQPKPARLLQQERVVQELQLKVDSAEVQLEQKVQRIVSTLASVTDSKESKTKIQQSKEKLIKLLNENAQGLANKRNKMVAELKAGRSYFSKKDLLMDIRLLDDSIDTRVKQITELTASFPEFKDLDKYKTYTTNYWGERHTERNRSEEYKQNKRETRRADFARSQMTKGADQSMEALEKQKAALEDTLKRTIGDEQKAATEKYIQYLDERIERRKKARNEITYGEGGKASKTVSSNQATQLTRDLEKDIKALQMEAKQAAIHRDNYDRQRAIMNNLNKQYGY